MHARCSAGEDIHAPGRGAGEFVHYHYGVCILCTLLTGWELLGRMGAGYTYVVVVGAASGADEG